ncbi:hypothetical protein RRF57_009882 [Xylaria bambusicola]|uniref:Uncharacterized protein n=1 Tax=Xylaria bambusicola TaxID=326684 RepID=A0AAN7URC3_9PEZI
MLTVWLPQSTSHMRRVVPGGTLTPSFVIFMSHDDPSMSLVSAGAKPGAPASGMLLRTDGENRRYRQLP